MLLNLAQSIINGFAHLLSIIVAILPHSPFEGFYSIALDSKWLGYLSYFLPINQMLAVFQAWGTAVLVYYAYMIPLRWIKAID